MHRDSKCKNKSRGVCNIIIEGKYHTSAAQSAGTVEYGDFILTEKCTGNDIKSSDGEAPVSTVLGNMEYPFIIISPRPGVVALVRVLSMGQIEL